MSRSLAILLNTLESVMAELESQSNKESAILQSLDHCKEQILDLEETRKDLETTISALEKKNASKSKKAKS